MLTETQTKPAALLLPLPPRRRHPPHTVKDLWSAYRRRNLRPKCVLGISASFRCHVGCTSMLLHGMSD